jgi:hypothetical protein
MNLTAAVFFHSPQHFDEAFSRSALTDIDHVLDYPLLREDNGNVRGTQHGHREHPAVLFEIADLRRHPAKGTEHLIQEMFAVKMDYDTADKILRQKNGRNKLRQKSRHFFLKLGHNCANHRGNVHTDRHATAA